MVGLLCIYNKKARDYSSLAFIFLGCESLTASITFPVSSALFNMSTLCLPHQRTAFELVLFRFIFFVSGHSMDGMSIITSTAFSFVGWCMNQLRSCPRSSAPRY